MSGEEKGERKYMGLKMQYIDCVTVLENHPKLSLIWIYAQKCDQTLKSVFGEDSNKVAKLKNETFFSDFQRCDVC